MSSRSSVDRARAQCLAWDSDFFFVTRSHQVDQFTFHISLPSSKIHHFYLLIKKIPYLLLETGESRTRRKEKTARTAPTGEYRTAKQCRFLLNYRHGNLCRIPLSCCITVAVARPER